MFQDLKNQRATFELVASRSGTRLKAILPQNNLEKKREVFCVLGKTNGPGYTTAKLTAVHISSFVKLPTIITC